MIRRPTLLRATAAVSLVSTLCWLPSATANTVVSDTCYPLTLGDRCYATITQGISSDRSTLTLSDLTSATAKIDIACQLPATSTNDFTNAELWLFTPPNSSGPGDPGSEWIETGISTGTLNGVYQ